MKFLIDTSPAKLTEIKSDLVCGQLCTPLTGYKNWGGRFAIDNGAFSGLNRVAWFRCLEKHLPFIDQCDFVVIPDVVGSSIRTTELYYLITQDKRLSPWVDKWCFVAQDGSEHRRIDWNAIRYLFIGGTNDFKDSWRAYDICKAAAALGIPVHVGRVNTYDRWSTFEKLGCATCDGSGIARFSHMLKDIETKAAKRSERGCVSASLFDEPVH